MFRVKTNLKLNLVSPGNPATKLIATGEEKDIETHFLTMEGWIPDIEVTQNDLETGKWWKNHEMFQDWTITDFDNILKGNPHI